MDLAEQLLDAVLAGNRFVVVEYQLRRTLQAQARADLPPQEPSRARQRALGVAPALLVAERSVVHASLLQVAAHLHPGQRHEPDARIVNLPGEQRGQLAADLIGHALGPGALRHFRISDFSFQIDLRFQDPTLGQSELNLQSELCNLQCHAVIATRSMANTSMTSPTLMSLNFSKPMPHSIPLFTSLTSSLNRRSDPILPS